MPTHVEMGIVAGVQRLAEDLWLIHLDLPEIAPFVEPGQFVLLRCADSTGQDPYLPRTYYVFAADREAGRLSLLVEERGRGSTWLCRRREGDRILVHGPAGRGVRPARLTRHLLLLADGAMGVAALSLVAARAAQQGLSVTLLENVLSRTTGVPPESLPVDVEYRTTSPEAGGLLPALPLLLRWADEVVVAAGPALLETISALRRSRLQPFVLHGSIPIRAVPLWDAASLGGGDSLPCGSGVCGACVVWTRGGRKLICRDGPAFVLEELRFASPPDDDGDEADEP